MMIKIKEVKVYKIYKSANACGGIICRSGTTVIMNKIKANPVCL